MLKSRTWSVTSSRPAFSTPLTRLPHISSNQRSPRYSLEVFASAENVLNHVNYGDYSRNMLSRFFNQPTSAEATRRVQVDMGFRF